MMSQPQILLSASETLLTDPVGIQALGFSPGERVRLSSELIDDAGVAWTAYGDYVADADGMIDVDRSASESGTFAGVDPAGLFWSMQPEGGAAPAFMVDGKNKDHMRGQPHGDPLGLQTITIRAAVGGKPVCESQLRRKRLSDDVESFDVEVGRLRGIAFRRKDRSKSKGAIMSLTGSGGGVELGYAPALASQGYDVFSLAYFAYPGVPDMLSDIDLEYFEEGFEWMKREFGASKCTVQGASRGGELSLVLAAYLPHHVSGAIPIVPMFVTSSGWNHETGETGETSPSWTYRGEDIPYVASMDDMPMEEMRRIATTMPNGFPYAPEFRKIFDHEHVKRDLAIPIERANCPLLLISGTEDEMWDCSWGSDIVVNRLAAKDYAHSYEHLALRETGHVTPLPNTITTFVPAIYHTLAEVLLACGGTPQGAARNSRLQWDAILAYYQEIFAE